MKWQEIEGWFDEFNYKMFQTIRLPANPTILEIGTFKGKSVTALRELFPDADIVTCDPTTNPDISEKFIQIRGQDLEWNRPINLLFIDSAHDYEDTKSLFDKFEPFIIKGGIIIFHDYHSQEVAGAEGVKRFVDELGNCELFTEGEFGGAIWRK